MSLTAAYISRPSWTTEAGARCWTPPPQPGNSSPPPPTRHNAAWPQSMSTSSPATNSSTRRWGGASLLSRRKCTEYAGTHSEISGGRFLDNYENPLSKQKKALAEKNPAKPTRQEIHHPAAAQPRGGAQTLKQRPGRSARVGPVPVVPPGGQRRERRRHALRQLSLVAHQPDQPAARPGGRLHHRGQGGPRGSPPFGPVRGRTGRDSAAA